MMHEPTLGDVLVRLDRSLDLQERSLVELKEERYWRRVSVTVVAVVFLGFALWVSVSRQSDCHRANASRTAAREAAVSDWDTAWEVLVVSSDPETEREKAALLTAIRENQERLRPNRDCAWPA